MQKSLFVLIGLLLVVSLTACGEDTLTDSDLGENQGKEVVSDNVKNEDNQDSAEGENGSGSDSSPHEFSGFTKDEEFSGGVTAKEYNLNSVRRGPHPSFTRLILDFTVGSKGKDSAVEPPEYEITYSDEANKITAVFEGVKYNSLEGKVEEIKQLAPIVEDVKFAVENNKLIMSLILKEKVSYQVFNLSSPARIAIVMNPDVMQ